MNPIRFFYVEPEVAGGLGEHTIMDRSVHPPIVSKLHYRFDGWLGDVLLETFPCFIVTELAQRKLSQAGASGLSFDELKVSTSEQFQEMNSNQELPRFVWLKVSGIPGRDDFGMSSNGRLVLSSRAIELLRSVGLNQALITEYGASTDVL